MNETVSLHLPQFAASDRIHHDDFNAAFAAIDTAVAANSTAITALESAKAGTADLSAEATARQNAVSAEATARQNADSAEATARQNADTAEATARQNADTALGGRIDAEAAARAAAIAAINANLGSHGHNCRIAFGSYTGSGSYGSTTPNTLTLDFYPVAVIIGSDTQADNVSNPTVLLRGRKKGLSDCAGEVSRPSDAVLSLTWGDSSVSWYNTVSQGYQNNRSGVAYYYVVLGYDKAAEDASE